MKLVVLSGRNLGQPIFWRNSVYPLESALASQPGWTLVAPPALRRGTISASRPAWLNAIRVVRRADHVFWSQMHLRPSPSLWALGYVNPLARRSAYCLDAFEPTLRNLYRIADAQRLTVCFIAYLEAFRALGDRFGPGPFEWLPIGFNRSVFNDLGLERDIDVYWMGRRHNTLHEAFLALAAERGLRYRYALGQTDPPTTVELNSLIARSRYFVVTPPNVGGTSRTGGFSPFTSRYLEGAAAGGRLLGVMPNKEEFAWYLPANAFVECAPDGSDLASVLDRADADPDAEAKRIAVRDLVHRAHSWEARAETIHHRLTALPGEHHESHR